jgi:hypothetical protein
VLDLGFLKDYFSFNSKKMLRELIEFIELIVSKLAQILQSEWNYNRFYLNASFMAI